MLNVQARAYSFLLSVFCAAFKAALDVPGFFDADCRLEKKVDGFAVTWLILTFVGGLLVAARTVDGLTSGFGTCAPFVAAFKGFVGTPELGFDNGAAIARFGGCNDENELSRCLFKPVTASEVRVPDAEGTVEPIAFDVVLTGV